MGIYDRDYYREEGGQRAFDNRFRACIALVVIYVCVYFVQIGTRERDGREWKPGPVTESLQLKANKVMEGEIWRIATYAFIHDYGSPLPIAFNIFFLIWGCRHVEDIYGTKEFLAFYLIAGLLAGLGFVLTAAISQTDPILIGPAGPMTAALLLFALHYPRRTVLLFFVLPVPVWFVVAFYVLSDVTGFFRGSLHPALFAAHAVAAAFAFLYLRYSLRVSNWLPGIPSRANHKKARPNLQIFRGPEVEPAAATSTVLSPNLASASAAAASNLASAQAMMDEHLEAKLDEVLEKVKKYGQESLSEEERAVLFRASEIYRKRRKSGGN